MSSTIPSALILINDSLDPSIVERLQRQLFIDETMDGYVFDDVIAADPNYLATIKRLDKRVMVIRPFYEFNNRNLFDVAAYVSHGMISVETNKFGPHSITYPVVSITWQKLCIFKR